MTAAEKLQKKYQRYKSLQEKYLGFLRLTKNSSEREEYRSKAKHVAIRKHEIGMELNQLTN